MSSYKIFYDIIWEIHYQRSELGKALYESVKDFDTNPGKCYDRMYEWCMDTLDILGVPEGVFRDCYIKELKSDLEELKDMIDWVIAYLKPEKSDEESNDESSE